MQKKSSLALAAIIIMAPVLALSHGGATGIVKERMDLMGVLGENMKALTAMMRGQADYDAGKVAQLASSIGGHGGEKMTKMFPEHSIHGPSEALPVIWKDWQRFSDLSRQLTDYAGALAQAAGNERTAAPAADLMAGGLMAAESAAPSAAMLAKGSPDTAFQQLADICSDCHEAFRKEKKK